MRMIKFALRVANTLKTTNGEKRKFFASWNLSFIKRKRCFGAGTNVGAHQLGSLF